MHLSRADVHVDVGVDTAEVRAKVQKALEKIDRIDTSEIQAKVQKALKAAISVETLDPPRRPRPHVSRRVPVARPYRRALRETQASRDAVARTILRIASSDSTTRPSRTTS